MTKQELDDTVDLTMPCSCLLDFHDVQLAACTTLLVNPHRVFICNASMEKSVVAPLSSRTFDDALADALKDGKRDYFDGRVAHAIVY